MSLLLTDDAAYLIRLFNTTACVGLLVYLISDLKHLKNYFYMNLAFIFVLSYMSGLFVLSVITGLAIHPVFSALGASLNIFAIVAAVISEIRSK